MITTRIHCVTDTLFFASDTPLRHWHVSVSSITFLTSSDLSNLIHLHLILIASATVTACETIRWLRVGHQNYDFTLLLQHPTISNTEARQLHIIEQLLLSQTPDQLRSQRRNRLAWTTALLRIALRLYSVICNIMHCNKDRVHLLYIFYVSGYNVYFTH